MAVQTNDVMVKQELIENFNTNLLNAIYSGAYHLTNLPRFKGSAGIWSNPQAIPSSQLSTATRPELKINDTMPTAGNTYLAMKTIVDGLTRIRYFTSNWYYQTNSSHGLINSVSGTAIFLASIPGVPTYSSGANKSGWTRTITGPGAGAASTASATLTTVLTVTNPLKQNEVILASKITPKDLNNSLYNYLYNAWAANRNNRLTYNFYTCHNNCWGACNPRSRR